MNIEHLLILTLKISRISLPNTPFIKIVLFIDKQIYKLTKDKLILDNFRHQAGDKYSQKSGKERENNYAWAPFNNKMKIVEKNNIFF